MHYQEFAPVPPLRPVVERLWTLTGDAADLAGHDQPVLPDGRPELILHFGDRFDRIDPDGHRTSQPSMIVAGQLTSQLLLRPTGRIGVLGIRFHPFGAASLGVGPLNQLSGLTIGIADVSPRVAAAFEPIRSATDDVSMAVPMVQRTLIRLIDTARIDEPVRHAVTVIGRRRGQVSIDRLASEVSWTRRHLERRFLDTVGIAPKRLARIARFQHALQEIERADAHRPGTTTAATCGYADQAHFIRDFRDLAGCSPGEHLLRQSLLTGFFARHA